MDISDLQIQMAAEETDGQFERRIRTRRHIVVVHPRMSGSMHTNGALRISLKRNAASGPLLVKTDTE